MTTISNYAQGNKLPYTINYMLDLQWQPRNNLVVQLGYVGNLARHQVVPVPLNQAESPPPATPLMGNTTPTAIPYRRLEIFIATTTVPQRICLIWQGNRRLSISPTTRGATSIFACRILVMRPNP